MKKITIRVRLENRLVSSLDERLEQELRETVVRQVLADKSLDLSDKDLDVDLVFKNVTSKHSHVVIELIDTAKELVGRLNRAMVPVLITVRKNPVWSGALPSFRRR